jgi:hypothetical protein
MINAYIALDGHNCTVTISEEVVLTLASKFLTNPETHQTFLDLVEAIRLDTANTLWMANPH